MPSSFKSAATTTGLAAGSDGCSGAWNDPFPLPRSTVMYFRVRSEATRSARPSPFKSAAAIAVVDAPTVIRSSGAKVPSPLPKKIETAPAP